MGFFTRHPKDDADPAFNPADSTVVSSQVPLQRRRNPAAVQRDNAANDLRRRARRRLVGAIAMVLAAVIVLPMVMDAPPATSPEDLAIEIPGRSSAFEPRFSEPARSPELPANAGLVTQGVAPLPAAPGEPAAAATDARVPASIATITPLPGSKPPPPPAEPIRKPEVQSPPAAPAVRQPVSPPSAPARSNTQDAEAARALALLQGRAPTTPAPAPAPSASSSSRYVVQVVAVRSRSGADELLARLRGAGLNAYIETIKSPDGEVHRVRLGPYGSRAQAEAAQARLQSVPGGYQGNLVPL